MKKSKIILLFLLAIVIATFSQLRAELPAPLITVDTVFKIQTNGSKGAVFLPDGNSVIMMCQDTPYLIDANTWTVIRQFEYKAGEETESPVVSRDGRYLFARTYSGLAVWDIQTGKIIKYLRNCVDYCLSPDGLKLYQTIINDKNKSGVIRVYDMNTLEEIEVFCNHDFWGAEEIAISPDGQTLAVCVSHDPIGNEGDNINRSVILIDLNKKAEFTRLESLAPWFYSIQFSPDGKYLIYFYNKSGSLKDYTYIYNLYTKEKRFLSDDDINILFGTNTRSQFGDFLDTNIITFYYSKFLLIWDFYENKLKSIVDFITPYIDINNNRLLLCDYRGNLALLDLSEVSVSEIKKYNASSITYKDSQLLFNLDKSLICEASIYDTTGKQIVNLGMQPVVIGTNILPVNQYLTVGTYILTLTSDGEQISYKFLVE